MKKLSLIIALALFLALSGCSEGFLYAEIPGMAPASPSPPPASPTPILLPSAAPRTYVFGMALSPVEKFQPLSDLTAYNANIARLCYEGLFEIDGSFRPQPALCVAATTADNTVYTLELRRGVTFHDGSEFTSADAVYSFSQAKLPLSPYSQGLDGVIKAEADGPNRLIVTFGAPTFNALAALDFPIIKNGSAPDASAPGTGPYRYVADGENTYLLVYGGWWKESGVPLARIELVEVSSADEMVYWFQTGYITVAALDPHDSFSPVLRSGYESWEYPSGNMVYFSLNTKRGPLDNPQIREALALTLNRRELTESVYGKSAYPSALPVPPASFLYSPEEASRYAYDPAEASRILDSLGYYDTDGDGVLELEPTQRVFEPLYVKIIVGAENTWRVKIAREYAKALKALGFDADVHVLEWVSFNKALTDGDYDICCAEALPSSDFSPGDFVAPGSPLNPGGYESAALTELVAALNAAPSGDESRAALEAVFAGIHSELPFLTVCFRSMSLQIQRGLAQNPTPVWKNPFCGWEKWTVNPP